MSIHFHPRYKQIFINQLKGEHPDVGDLFVGDTLDEKKFKGHYDQFHEGYFSHRCHLNLWNLRFNSEPGYKNIQDRARIDPKSDPTKIDTEVEVQDAINFFRQAFWRNQKWVKFCQAARQGDVQIEDDELLSLPEANLASIYHYKAVRFFLPLPMDKVVASFRQLRTIPFQYSAVNGDEKISGKGKLELDSDRLSLVWQAGDQEYQWDWDIAEPRLDFLGYSQKSVKYEERDMINKGKLVLLELMDPGTGRIQFEAIEEKGTMVRLRLNTDQFNYDHRTLGKVAIKPDLNTLLVSIGVALRKALFP